MFLFLFAIGIALVAARAGRASASAPAAPMLLAPPATVSPAVASGVPSPLLVMDGFLRQGLRPPPEVIMCAIAEAELMGRLDVAGELVSAFILPVVQAAQARGWDGRSGYDQPGAISRSGPSWIPVPDQAHPHPHHQPGDPGDPRGPRVDLPVPMPHPGMPGMPGMPHPGDPRDIARAEDARVEIIREAPAPQSPRPSGTPNAGTITVSGMSSPIDRVSNQEWSEFVGRIAREQVTFTSPHHVGQFRQRRSRLAELGIDPASVVGSPVAQASALCADMGDAYHHALDSGLVAEYRGVAVDVPVSGQAVPIEVTLSGVMGVIQAAGLEGAAGWLEDPEDRSRFPHTTQAFLRTNGVF